MEGKTMKAAIAFLVSVLGQALYILLLLGAALGLFIGIMLLIDSQRVLRWNAYLNRWMSTGESSRVLDQPHDLNRIVYRRHRVVGVVVLAASLYALDVLVFNIQTRTLVHIFRDLANPATLQLFVEGARLFLIGGNAHARAAAAAVLPDRLLENAVVEAFFTEIMRLADASHQSLQMTRNSGANCLTTRRSVRKLLGHARACGGCGSLTREGRNNHEKAGRRLYADRACHRHRDPGHPCCCGSTALSRSHGAIADGYSGCGSLISAKRDRHCSSQKLCEGRAGGNGCA